MSKCIFSPFTLFLDVWKGWPVALSEEWIATWNINMLIVTPAFITMRTLWLLAVDQVNNSDFRDKASFRRKANCLRLLVTSIHNIHTILKSSCNLPWGLGGNGQGSFIRNQINYLGPFTQETVLLSYTSYS